MNPVIVLKNQGNLLLLACENHVMTHGYPLQGSRLMYVCIPDQHIVQLVHKNLPTTPEAFLRVIIPYRAFIIWCGEAWPRDRLEVGDQESGFSLCTLLSYLQRLVIESLRQSLVSFRRKEVHIVIFKQLLWEVTLLDAYRDEIDMVGRPHLRHFEKILYFCLHDACFSH